MSKSHAFMPAMALIVIVLALTLFLMIASTTRTPGEWKTQGMLYVNAMFVGGDDTLYVSDGNDLTAIRGDGSVAWSMAVPPGWAMLEGLDIIMYSGQGDPGTRYFSITAAADEDDGYVYLYMCQRVPADNLTDADMARSYVGIRSKIVAISPEGKIIWEYPFVSNISLWTRDRMLNTVYGPTDKIVIQAYNGRIYVFHDHREDVLGEDGHFLFSIADVAEPATADEMGNVYVVHAIRPPLQTNGSMENPDWIALGALGDNEQYSGEDLTRLAYDPTYMARTNTIEAYSPSGVLLWSRDLGERIAGTYDNLADQELILRTMPLYMNGMLYVPVIDGTAALGTDGSVRWVRHLDGYDLYTPFSVLPLDESGNAYMAAANGSTGNTYVSRISPSGGVSYDVWAYPTQSSPAPAASPDGTVYLFENSTPIYLTDQDFSLAVDGFDPDTLTASDISDGGTRWTFTVPRDDIRTVTLNATNLGVAMIDVTQAYIGMNSVPGQFAGWPADSVTLQPVARHRITIKAGSSFVYMSYRNMIYEDPVIFNRSRCAYVNELYALDRNGSLIWKQQVDGVVDRVAAGNNTIYYNLFGGGLGGGKVSMAAAGFAFIAFAYALLRFFMVGAVARAKGRLDQNENRGILLQYIVDHPGVTAVDVARGMHMNLGTIRYHLLILTLNHRIVTHRDDGKFLRYFKNSGAYTDEEKALLSLMRRKPIQRILNVLLEKGRLSGPDLARELNISATAVNRHIAELSGKGILERHPGSDRGYEYSIKTERYESIRELMSYVYAHHGPDRVTAQTE